MFEEAGVDIVFLPESADMYPQGFDTYVEVESIREACEAKSRPGFFKGVTTVVSKLANIVQPHNMYFGQKDGIQCITIRKMIRDLNFPIEIIVGETIREPDGLAKSSRNVYLSKVEREIAPIFFKALSTGKDLYEKNSRDSREDIIESTKQILALEQSIILDYISLADLETGKEIACVPQSGAMLSGAIKIGKTRLIDNVILRKG